MGALRDAVLDEKLDHKSDRNHSGGLEERTRLRPSTSDKVICGRNLRVFGMTTAPSEGFAYEDST